MTSEQPTRYRWWLKLVPHRPVILHECYDMATGSTVGLCARCHDNHHYRGTMLDDQ